MARKMNEQWDVVIQQFERINFNLADRVVDWYPSGYQEITVKLDNGKTLVYNHITQKIRYVSDRSENITELDDEAWQAKFAEKLANKIRMFGITQEQLSEMTGISQVSISGYKKGKKMPSVLNCKKLAKALRCSISELADIE